MADRLILVGDNPFHGVSHVSRERSLLRASDILNTKHAADLVINSIDNGANGFTFTVSETTYSILSEIGKRNLTKGISLYPLVPNVNEAVRTAGAAGGIPGLAKDVAKKMFAAMDFNLLFNAMNGVIANDPKSLLKAYLKYEYLKLQRIVKKKGNLNLTSILLHEVVTDMALALDMEWLIRAHIELMTKLGLKPGFETRNLPYFVKQINKWKIGTQNIVIEAPFNPIGFQMCPSKSECEDAINLAPGSEIIAFSILAAGYVKLPQALQYVSSLKGISGVAIGVSNEKQAMETFSLTSKEFLSHR